MKLLQKIFGVIIAFIGITLSGYAMSLQCSGCYCNSIWCSGLTLYLIGCLIYFK